MRKEKKKRKAISYVDIVYALGGILEGDIDRCDQWIS
jgi:hypothetical protein